MKNKSLWAGLGVLTIGAVLLAMINTDALYIDAAVFFFVLCIAYAGWCRRL